MSVYWTESIAAKVQAGLDSIRYRQSLSKAGGIVESDPRVDRGNYLYADRCWPRNYQVEPLLQLGELEMVLANLGYWQTALNATGEGFFRHNYHYQTGEAFSDHEQIDNNAHMMFNICHVCAHSGAATAEPFLPMLAGCGDYLLSRLDPEFGMLRGREERVVEGVAFPECFSFYINRICAEALERGAEILDKPDWIKTAADVREGVREKLWSAERQTYAYLMFVPDADHEHAGKLSFDESWGMLWPYMHDSEFEEKDRLSIRQRIDALWQLDPLLPQFICQKEPQAIYKLLETGDDKPAFHYSGVGVCPAANAVAAIILAEHKTDLELSLKLWKPLESCPGDLNLLPEHINTMHPGRMKDYALWPDAASSVDSGNLMHLTMFMTAALRLKLIDESTATNESC